MFESHSAGLIEQILGEEGVLMTKQIGEAGKNENYS
jgi:hypothetical protein